MSIIINNYDAFIVYLFVLKNSMHEKYPGLQLFYVNPVWIYIVFAMNFKIVYFSVGGVGVEPTQLSCPVPGV